MDYIKAKKLIPESVSECAIHVKSDVCMSEKTARAIAASAGVPVQLPPRKIVEEVKKKWDCDTERCVLTHAVPYIGEARVRQEIFANLKIKGPTDSKLLSNVNIDNTLKQWSIVFQDFFPYNFNMINYASYSFNNGYVENRPDTLATIQFEDLFNGTHDGKQYRCAACVINSDTYQGPGKHWMALFVDARGPRYTVEFFNSSGKSPAPEWVNWMQKTKTQLENIIRKLGVNAEAEMIKTSTLKHQRSKSECGLYSLFYIWARLNKIPIEYFMNTRVPDEQMFEFRQHLFDDPNRKAIKKFDWDEYKKIVRIEWE